jgi:COP9 signalosome complex subunit 6
MPLVKTVHKDRQLDFVGWYTLLPKSGPTTTILPIHETFLADYNQSAVLLGFHPEEVISHEVGGKLPLTIYESNYEVDDPKGEGDGGEDKKMEDGQSTLKIRFRELPYSVETAEAEMISMDFISKGGGTATAAEPKEKRPAVALVESEVKGKRRVIVQEDSMKSTRSTELAAQEVVLSREEEEMIAALTAKANAIKMLHSRIHLISTYMENLPPEFQQGQISATEASRTAETDPQATTPSHTILRSIQALVSRLELIVPSDTEAFQQEMLREENDVNLVALLNEVMQSVQDARDVGKKYSVVESAKTHNRRMGGDYAGGSGLSFSLGGAGDILT